jgi:hypothetical protein
LAPKLSGEAIDGGHEIADVGTADNWPTNPPVSGLRQGSSGQTGWHDEPGTGEVGIFPMGVTMWLCFGDPDVCMPLKPTDLLGDIESRPSSYAARHFLGARLIPSWNSSKECGRHLYNVDFESTRKHKSYTEKVVHVVVGLANDLDFHLRSRLLESAVSPLS